MFRLIDAALLQPLNGRFEPSRQDCVNDIHQTGQTAEKAQIGRDDTPFLKRSRRRRARRSIS
tara:strand:- start:23066 stop:23251 length:186 start_codon:yes stop_codon:yes gene_type:complete